MVAVSEGEDKEVAEPRFGISDIREGWVATDLVVLSRDRVCLLVLAEAAASRAVLRSVAYALRASGVAAASPQVADSAG